MHLMKDLKYVHYISKQMCQVMNDNVMRCPTPSLVDALKNIIRSKRSSDLTDRTSNTIKAVYLGFIMDDVMSVRNLSSVPNLNFKLLYFSNPRIYNFTEPNGVKILKGDSLIIEVSKMTP